MARLNRKVQEKKMREAKQLFMRDFSLQDISDIIQISVTAIRGWRNENDWEEERKLNHLSVSSMKAEILNAFSALKEGKTPNIKPDDIAKLASAFEKLSDKRKHLAYMFSCFEDLSEALAANIVTAKTKKEKETAHLIYTESRRLMDQVVDKTFKEVMNE